MLIHIPLRKCVKKSLVSATFLTLKCGDSNTGRASFRHPAACAPEQNRRGSISHGGTWKGRAFRRLHSVSLVGYEGWMLPAPGHWAEPHCGTTCSSASRKSIAGRHCRTASQRAGSSHCHNCSSGCVSAFAPVFAAHHSSGADQPLPNTSLNRARFPSSSRTTAAS